MIFRLQFEIAAVYKKLYVQIRYHNVEQVVLFITTEEAVGHA